MKRNHVPSYLHHKQSGRARAVWTDSTGQRREQLLPGSFNSEESKSAYARIVAELAVSPTAVFKPSNGVTINEVMLAYLRHAERYYVKPDGSPASELANIKCAVRPVRELYGATQAAEFGPLALRAVRGRMIEADLCRSEINRRMERIRRMFKWAVAEELVPAGNLEALRALPGLRRGRSEARESKPVKPVADEVVRATLPHLPPHVRAIVALLDCTGMRPGEVCGMKLADIDRSGETWVYRPAHHKTAHHGRDRSIPLGPKARAVVLDHLRGRSFAPDEYLFSPIRQREERFANIRANRKSKVTPSQVCRKKSKPVRLPRERYSPEAIAHAVTKACKAANVAHWHPYQLRHSFASKVRKAHGLEAAQVLLGHARADVTQVYAERNEELASKVAAQVG